MEESSATTVTASDSGSDNQQQNITTSSAPPPFDKQQLKQLQKEASAFYRNNLWAINLLYRLACQSNGTYGVPLDGDSEDDRALRMRLHSMVFTDEDVSLMTVCIFLMEWVRTQYREQAADINEKMWLYLTHEVATSSSNHYATMKDNVIEMLERQLQRDDDDDDSAKERLAAAIRFLRGTIVRKSDRLYNSNTRTSY